jgi:hypothetical protein
VVLTRVSTFGTLTAFLTRIVVENVLPRFVFTCKIVSRVQLTVRHVSITILIFYNICAVLNPLVILDRYAIQHGCSPL